MQRRRFLQGAIVGGLTLSVGPRVLVPMPGETEPSTRSAWRSAQLQAAWRQAAQRRVPLLFIVIPEGADERWSRGRVWGEVITHGPEKLIEALCTVELVAATQAEVAALLPDFTPATPEPLAIRVDPTVIPAQWSVAPYTVEAPTWGGRGYDPEQQKQEEAAIDDRIGAVSMALLMLIHPTSQTLAQVPAGAPAARRKDPIPGARWGYSGGCGTDYETLDPLHPEESLMAMVDCGMGHVSSRSARFLDFLVAP